MYFFKRNKLCCAGEFSQPLCLQLPVVRIQLASEWSKMILTKEYFKKVCLLRDFFYVQGYFFNPLQKQPRVLYEALWLLMFQHSWTKTNFLPLQYLEYLGSILKNKATDLALISKTDFWTLWKKARVGCFKRTASKHVYYLGWNRSPAQVGCMRQVLGPGGLGRPRGIRWRGRWKGGLGWGIHVYPWLIHVNIWQKPLQYCKVISLQLIKKKKNSR